MPDLFIHGDEVNSVFQLLGKKEDDISFSVGYSFSKCSVFFKMFLDYLNLGDKLDFGNAIVRLQEYESKKGFTDFEIIIPNQLHLIIEAKRGWIFPSKKQLGKYVSRESFRNSNSKQKKVIVFNESNEAYLKANFHLYSIDSISIEVVPWVKLKELALKALNNSSNKEKWILRELIAYLKNVSSMQNIDSNLVYVVSLGSKNPENWQVNWKDIVNKKMKYFHPVGGGKGGWPNEPPNYIAFRYSGELQSIHHIDSYEVFTNPRAHFLEIPDEEWPPHYLYTLGEPIRPNKTMKSGKRIVRSMRVWAMIDLLLTSTTIEEARDKTKERLNK